MNDPMESPELRLPPTASAVTWADALRKANFEFNSEIRRTNTTVSHLEGVRPLVLTDCQVSSRSVDDRMYKKFAGLPQAQPRGLCFLTNADQPIGDSTLNTSEAAGSDPGAAVMDVSGTSAQQALPAETGELVYVLRGLQKFGEEKDVSAYFLKGAAAEVTDLVFMEKANGENAKISAVTVDGVLVWMVASKNVTLIATDCNFEADIEHEIYKNLRFTYTLKIARQWYTQLRRMSAQQKEQLVLYLCTHMATLVGEVFLSDSQHIVDMSYMDRSEAEGQSVRRLQFYVIVDVRPESEGLLSVQSPVAGLELLQQWGLGVVPHVTQCAVSDKAAVEEAYNSARYRENSEGAVVYGVSSTAQNGGKTTFIYKYKNTWYVYWRAVRELMRARAPLSRLRKRLSSEMYLPHPNIDAFVQEASEFYAYCRYRVEVEKSSTWEKVFAFWYDCMNSFKSASAEHIATALRWLETEMPIGKPQLQVAMMGIPGTGKSTQARALSTLLALPWVNQDELNMKASRYHSALTDTTQRKVPQGVIADKCHHNFNVRNGMRRALKSIMSLVYIVFLHPDDLDSPNIDHTLAVARERIEKREFGHRTLFEGPILNQAFARFESEWTPLSQQERNEAVAVINVSILLNPTEACKLILTELANAQLLERDIPDDSEVASALAQAKEFEAKLNDQNCEHTTTLTWSLQISESGQNLIRTIAWPRLESSTASSTPATESPMQTATSADALPVERYCIQPSFHVTLLFMTNDVSPALEERDNHLLQRSGSKVSIACSRISYSSKAAALIVDPESMPEWLRECAEPPMHVTLAVGYNPKNGHKYPPVEARKLLTGSVGEGTTPSDTVKSIELPEPIVLEGIVTRKAKLRGTGGGANKRQKK
ncbi:hypothetical protein SARC_01664 [Sphaeroforma arctica JP610]|uniref:DUF7920 domain-containing protein n=1 Tax=Sphaeroforma arctica JP610 TaxID=667725 RepID=A0A0L0GAZ5_9EUKA|nr:hypothetical protein SARC_01664 [Sphaeroforma arctica JP610]KNC86187.1 hypothetical protein SARC_01664 [Sphaeroforma arctica JP610]|eukprot:XP_014160089.1 hypothetical protein SARC_01664 [Sphaeroforma arctica JP610]